MEIVIPIKKVKVKNPEILEDYVEVSGENLQFFQGCWVKYRNKRSKEYNPGGFLVKIDGSYVYIRHNFKSELSEVTISENIFYLKNNTPNYNSMQSIELKKQELDHDLKKLRKQEFEFNNIKYNFYKLFTDGKVKITKK